MTSYVPYVIELLFLICMFAIVAMSLNLTIGYTGLFNLGQVGFFALGALGSTIATVGIETYHPGLGFFAGAMLGIFISLAVCVVIGIPSLRLKGDYFAIATLGFGEIVRVVLKAYDPFALAVDGVPRMTFGRIDSLGLAGYTLKDQMLFGFFEVTWEEQELWIAFLLALGCAILVQRLVKSPYGRLLKAIREDEVAAKAIGKDVEKYKMQAFLVGAAMASLAGSLWVHHITVFAPVNFTIQLTITFLVMVILGGMGSNFGAILGAICITLFYYLLPLADFPENVDPGAINLMIFSILIIVIVLFRPKGIMGHREFDLNKMLIFLRLKKPPPGKAKTPDDEMEEPEEDEEEGPEEEENREKG
jgi:branched-chain amino acid transport system permease protein